MKEFNLVVRLSTIIATLIAPILGLSQAPAVPEPLQQKIQAMQQAADQNEQRLHQYQWIEAATVRMNGTPRPPKQSICRYNTYGTLVKTPIGAQEGPPPVSGGPIRRRIVEKKIEEAEQDLAEIRSLTALYLPINPGVLRQALQTRRIDVEHESTGGNALVINDYAKSGDRLILDLDTEKLQLRRITVKSFFSSPSDAFTATVQFSVLEDGTAYPSISNIDALGKKLSITTVSSNFSKPVQ